ncbi:exocyst complex component 8-like [Clytia hemisphaerica]|uniref:Exocyst component Exo84 C-terminal domain-containing protein n=1 Tax=Clytia hemisphaerica TaxID=252671 RepID=A0A7M5XJC3_9CNID|eukprot:TCONS_00050831-protein
MKLDEVSSPVLAKKFSAPDFNPEDYVKTILSKCDIYRTLFDQRNNIQKLGEETAVSLKKNVYRNYKQFIDTAKEISYLEAEMYQLSHLLTEQKSILADQLETDIFERPKGLPVALDPEVEAYENKKKSFLESIKVSKQLMDELESKELILEDHLTEYDPETYSSIQKVGAHLVTDNLMITNEPKTGKADILTMFDLCDLAVVNVRDGQGVKNAFKILYSLETRMFGASTKDMKLSWLDQIERAKRNYKKGVQMDADKLAEMRQIQQEESAQEIQHKKEEESRAEAEIAEQESQARDQSFRYPNLLNVDWLVELPEDLDMCIAQRDFEGAVQLVERGRTYLADFQESPPLKEIRDKIESRVEQLVTVLEKSLDNSSSSRHVSLRSIRVYVLLLIRLGRGKLACELFLRNRGFEIKNSFKQLKMEGATAIYVRKLASVFFTSVIETGREYKRNFTLNSNCSAFVVWLHNELQNFAEKFTRQVFTRNTNLQNVGLCISLALTQCQRLNSIGIDLTFDLQHMFLKEVMTAVFDARDQIMERAKSKAMDDNWVPMTLATDELDTLVGEIDSLNLQGFQPYVKGNVIHLSTSTINFTKSFLVFMVDVLGKFYTTEIHDTLTQCVREIFKAQSIQFESLIRDPNLKDRRQFIYVNAEFIFGKVFKKASDQMKELTGHELASLQPVNNMMERLRHLK